VKDKDLNALAAEITAEHESAKRASAAGVEHARNAGEKLAVARDRLKDEHGWLKWLKDKTGIPPRTAQRYLKIYQNWSICATVAHLGVQGVDTFLRTGRTGEEDEEEKPSGQDKPFCLVSAASGVLGLLRKECERWPATYRGEFASVVRFQLACLEGELEVALEDSLA
jgi:hypothetical protein